MNMIATKPMTTKSFMFSELLGAIQDLTYDEVIFLKRELNKTTSKKRNGTPFEKSDKPDNESFFLFGKWPDFEDAGTLRAKAWKRNSI